MTNSAAPLLTMVMYHCVRPLATRRFPRRKAWRSWNIPGQPGHRPAHHRIGPAVVPDRWPLIGPRLDTRDPHGRAAGTGPCPHRTGGPRA
ncbi:hypothetical protein [Gemmobacter sp.]|uniref:hypothetical protein n=1 Tax=Gemmobacter sp. TaxID=1898957 RepID=UPI002AFF1258|nr:hypothetical protein [Gemmobacter sp.]